jgi:protocadherin-16/23
LDANDNVPRFTQDDYSAVVWEGNAKGTFVTQVLATDQDSGVNARLSYHIVDGNQDNAFLIEPPYSGIVTTNIVLDREIRDSYLLTVIATDEGSPQRTGTCLLKVNIVDVNDNQPTFPPHSLVSVSEGAPVGTVVMTVTANDVDTNPILTYSFVDQQSDSADVSAFTLDRFTGRLLLAAELDFERQQTYHLHISASDSLNTARTVLTVQVQDENDNAPQFALPAYMASVSVNSKAGTSVVQLTATDKDSNRNGKIVFSLQRNMWSDMFHIDAETGVLYVNKTFSKGLKPAVRLTSMLPRTPLPSVMRLIVIASDQGRPKQLSSSVPVHIHLKRSFGVNSQLSFPKPQYL